MISVVSRLLQLELLICLSTTMLLAAPDRLQAQTKTRKVLFLGNSYTASNNLPVWVEDLAASVGDSLIWQAITPGGQTLMNHVNDAQVQTAIQQGGWEFIVLQEQSQVPVIPYHRENLMLPAAEALGQLRNIYSPTAGLLFFMTWGREQGGQQCANGYCSYPFADFFGYQDTLTWAYLRAADSVADAVAPAGEMWREAMLQYTTSLPPLQLFSGDGAHPSVQGTYLTALTMFSCMFGKLTQAVPYQPSGIAPALDQYFRQIVDANVWPKKQLWGLSGGPASGCADTANIYTFTFDGRTYEVIREKQTWANAAACAVERGGKLVEINSQAEQDTVYHAIINGAGVPVNYTAIPNGGNIAYVWIGATDQQVEGTWRWDGDNDGSGLHFWTGQGANGANNGVVVGGAFVNWGGKSTGTMREPDDYGNNQDCAAIGLAGWPAGTGLLGIAGEWNDIISSSLLYYVVEYDSLVTGIGRISPAPEVDIYPNPARHEILVQADKLEKVELMDLQGRCLLTSDSTRIALQDVPAGLYLMRIQAGGRMTVRKLIIQ